MKRDSNQSQSSQTIYQTIVTLPCDEHGAHTAWLSTDDIDDAMLFTHLFVKALDAARLACRITSWTSNEPATDVGPRDPEYRAALGRALGVNEEDIPF